jgi:hypothetical protein
LSGTSGLGDAEVMRSRHALPLALLALSMPGCLIDRSAIGGDDAGGGGIDAYLDPSVDASLDAARPPDTNTDAWLDPSLDAWAPDAFVPPPDAWAPDAWTPDAFGADAWAPDAWAPDAFSCMPRCEGNVLVACDGSRTTCVACGTSDAVAEPHCLELVPSNTGSVDLTGRADEVNLTSVVTWDTSTCNSGGLSGVAREIGHEVTVEGVDLCVVLTNRFTLSGELRVVGDRSLVIVARDRIDITASGVLTVASLNDESTGTCGRDVIGAGAQPMSAAQAGQNGVAGSTGSFNPDSGGGGGGRCGGGGRGGDGLGADGLGDAAGGDGGSGAAVDDLVPLVGGTPGGNGFGRVGEGGAGGGAVQLSAPRVSVLGQILAHGAGGLGGGLENAGRRRGAGGGGGSGGAIHLEGARAHARRGLDARCPRRWWWRAGLLERERGRRRPLRHLDGGARDHRRLGRGMRRHRARRHGWFGRERRRDRRRRLRRWRGRWRRRGLRAPAQPHREPRRGGRSERGLRARTHGAHGALTRCADRSRFPFPIARRYARGLCRCRSRRWTRRASTSASARRRSRVRCGASSVCASACRSTRSAGR